MSGPKLRILTLVHRHLMPPDKVDKDADITSAPWRTEYDVTTTLTAMGHEVHTLAVHDDLGDLRRVATELRPHIAFNLLEGFDDIAIFDQNVVSHLELLKLPYTGCNPRGLVLARDKSLSKKLLAYHRIPVPEFEVFRAGRPIHRPKRLPYPLIVKSLTQEASIGISQASVVDTDERLRERVAFIHGSIGTAAIAEQYVEGREVYVGILGNQLLQALPPWELFFSKMPDGSRRIATDRVKWNVKYQRKYGIERRTGCRLRRRRGRAYSTPLQARLPGARTERLRPHRPADRRIRAPVGPRSQPQPADCAGRGLRGLSRRGGHVLRGGAPAHHQPGAALAPGECGVMGRDGLGDRVIG